MKKWIILILLLLSIGLIGVNSYFIAKKGDAIERTVYVEEWIRANTGDVVKSFSTDGVVVSSAKQDVFFEQENKEFLQFLVQVGDEVEAGTPLFEYRVPEQEQFQASLEAEITQREGEITSIEDYIDSLRSYQVRLPDSDVELEDRDYEVEEKLNIVGEKVTSDMISSAITQEIFKKQLELDQLEGEIERYEEQLNNLDTEEDQAVLTEEAQVAGTVIQVEKSLTNPVITIATNELAIEGKLTNEQLQKVEVGMDVRASVQGVKDIMETTLENVEDYPIEEPTIGESSFYRYQVAITDPSESLVVGANAKVSILTEQANQVTTIKDKSVVKEAKPFVYHLTASNKIVRQPVQTGLFSKGKTEVVNGLKPKDVVVTNPYAVSIDKKSLFTTKMKLEEFRPTSFLQYSKREWLELVLMGLLEK
ncbi:hypothetical protein KO561_15095 [Radiobacillus kanasensis]|uniref:efflux RND transporter periplasmic adaptor subunit n=1 Tax=Radiobacillus kanasensis TaxID=2844358 RepID=UPI001E3A1685|nr:hypothetical protein [Radiobacillus kanasensis]UFT98511.1 hypothetical protein KO561_15095 [Radiobacillus kanasensis]